MKKASFHWAFALSAEEVRLNGDIIMSGRERKSMELLTTVKKVKLSVVRRLGE